jgi:hypothetical protein
MFPPRGNRPPVLAAATLATAAVIAAGLVVGHAVPGMAVFAVAFVALVGAMVTMGVARSRRLHRPTSGPAVAAAGVAGVAACIAATGYMLRTDPSAAQALGPTHAIMLAVVLAGCLWLALAPPRGLASSRLARRIGLGAALALGAGLLASARVDDDQTGVMGYVIFARWRSSFSGRQLPPRSAGRCGSACRPRSGPRCKPACCCSPSGWWRPCAGIASTGACCWTGTVAPSA